MRVAVVFPHLNEFDASLVQIQFCDRDLDLEILGFLLHRGKDRRHLPLPY